MEIKTLAFETYADKDGEPTCGSAEGRCAFLCTRNFGTVDVCVYPSVLTEDARHPGDLRRRRPHDTGFLIPHRLCPFHAK